MNEDTFRPTVVVLLLIIVGGILGLALGLSDICRVLVCP